MKKIEKSVAHMSQDVFKSDISSSDLVVRILTFQAHKTGETFSSTGLYMPCPCNRADCIAGNASPPRVKSQPPAVRTCPVLKGLIAQVY